MMTTAGQVRAMLAGLTDDAPVFADVWGEREIESWITALVDDHTEDAGDDCLPPDLSDASTLRRALECIPDAWSIAGDDLSDRLTAALYDAFITGGAE